MILQSSRPSSPAMHGSRRQYILFATAMLAVTFAGKAWADGYLPSVGGNGGSQFKVRCGEGDLLNGLDVRAGNDVDAIQPVCVTARGPSQIEASPTATDATWYGGSGGSIQRLLCPNDQPIVVGMRVAAEGADTIVVNNIALYCGLATGTGRQKNALPAAILDAPIYEPSNGPLLAKPPRDRYGSMQCPEGNVAVGVHGRSGAWLDSIGLICGEPQVRPLKGLGKTKTPRLVTALGQVLEGVSRQRSEPQAPIVANEVPGRSVVPQASRSSTSVKSGIATAVPSSGSVLGQVRTDFAGGWGTVTGSGTHYQMNLTQDGSQITGTYSPNNGTIASRTVTSLGDGRLEVTFTWKEGSGSTGAGRFVLSADGRTFDGSYSLDHNPARVTETWRGARQ